MPRKITQWTILSMAKETLERRIKEVERSEEVEAYVSWSKDIEAQLNAIKAQRNGYPLGGLAEYGHSTDEKEAYRKPMDWTSLNPEEYTPKQKTSSPKNLLYYTVRYWDGVNVTTEDIEVKADVMKDFEQGKLKFLKGSMEKNGGYFSVHHNEVYTITEKEWCK